MPTITLKNPNIQQKETSTLKTYYLIKDPDNSDNAFFAFECSLSHFNNGDNERLKRAGMN